MRFCPKCGDFDADRLLAFCLADGTPLVDVDPRSDAWSQGVRVIDRKALAARAQNRTLKWRRVMLRAMLMTTMAVSVATAYSSISVTVVQPRGELNIGTFNDLNGNGVQDGSEPGLSGFGFQVNGDGPATPLTTGADGLSRVVLPVGAYTVVLQPPNGWAATTPATQTVTVTAGQAANLLFGSRQESGELGIKDFNDLNGNGVPETNEPGLPGFVFQVLETDPAVTVTTGPDGVTRVVILPVGNYTVVGQPQNGWAATTPAAQTVTVTAGRPANLLFGSKQERGDLAIQVFNDVNNNRERDQDEPGLSGFVFRVSETDLGRALIADLNGVCRVNLPVGTHTVVIQPKPGWIATTPTTLTVTVIADKTARVLFGSKQETGTLCITKFDDLNGNGKQERNEPRLSGFVFEVRGTGPTTTYTTGLEGSVCCPLPAGAYTVVDAPTPGWIATTKTTQRVTVTANDNTDLVFGHTKPADPAPECSDAQVNREREIILKKFADAWSRIIEDDRPEIIAKTRGEDVSLGSITYRATFFKSCTIARVTASYAWQVNKSKLQIRDNRSFECTKAEGIWDCRQFARSSSGVTFRARKGTPN